MAAFANDTISNCANAIALEPEKYAPSLQKKNKIKNMMNNLEQM